MADDRKASRRQRGRRNQEKTSGRYASKGRSTKSRRRSLRSGSTSHSRFTTELRRCTWRRRITRWQWFNIFSMPGPTLMRGRRANTAIRFSTPRSGRRIFTSCRRCSSTARIDGDERQRLDAAATPIRTSTSRAATTAASSRRWTFWSLPRTAARMKERSSMSISGRKDVISCAAIF